jgi:hypothetical protein
MINLERTNSLDVVDHPHTIANLEVWKRKKGGWVKRPSQLTVWKFDSHISVLGHSMDRPNLPEKSGHSGIPSSMAFLESLEFLLIFNDDFHLFSNGEGAGRGSG